MGERQSDRREEGERETDFTISQQRSLCLPIIIMKELTLKLDSCSLAYGRLLPETQGSKKDSGR